MPHIGYCYERLARLEVNPIQLIVSVPVSCCLPLTAARAALCAYSLTGLDSVLNVRLLKIPNMHRFQNVANVGRLVDRLVRSGSQQI